MRPSEIFAGLTPYITPNFINEPYSPRLMSALSRRPTEEFDALRARFGNRKTRRSMRGKHAANWMGIPTLDELSQYNVNRPDQIEAIKQSLYSRLTYTAAGVAQLKFFQTQVGAAASPTLGTTNMRAAGSLPAPLSFLVQTIELFMFPTAVLTATGAAAVVAAFSNDIWLMSKGVGWLEFYIGSKAYLDEAPLMKFPPRAGLGGFTSMAGQGTDDAFTILNYASPSGPVYDLVPPILLVPTQNFEITLNWPTATTVVLSADMDIVCNLGGILYRNSQ